MVIRWLGAFRKQGSLEDSLKWELTQAPSAVAAERLINGKSAIHHAKIGLLVKNAAILRKFRSDVWSEYRNGSGKLVKTRREGFANSKHTECWVQPVYLAIVIKGKVSDQALQACRNTGLPMLRLTRDGRLIAL